MLFKKHIQALRGPILVTGASGFVGANLFKMILDVRGDVFAVVRRQKGWRLNTVDDSQIVVADLNDSAAVKNLVDSISPQTIFDCASYGAYSFEEDARLIYQTNFQSLVGLIEPLAKKGIAAYIHAGSSSEYGANCAAPVESAALKPNSHYAVSKVAASHYLAFMGQHQKFPCLNLRLYSVYGPLEDSSRLIPNLVRNAMVKKLPPLVDPETSRDFIYIDDVCEAFVLAATKMQPDIYGRSFNIGSGLKTTIRELAEITRAQFQITEAAVYNQIAGRAWDLPEWYSQPQNARTHLNWTAKTLLGEGLSKTAEWIQSLSDDEFRNHSKRHLPNPKRSLSAIIACYKDGLAIPHMYQRLTTVFQKIGIDYEIIFVNDASPDASADVIRELSQTDPRVIGITHSRNFGSQMAFRSGMELSTKNGVVLLDGDLQDPPELIEDFFREWEKGFDVIYGRRIKRDMPWHWGLMYKMFYRLFATLSYVKIPHDAGDFSLIDERAARWILKCPERDLFMRGLRAYIGFKQTGVDYVRPERMFGVSTNSFFKNLDWAKKGIFSFSNTPLTMLTITGVVLLIVSFLLSVLCAALRIFYPDIAPRGATTLLIAILAFGSLNLFAIGLVGEYVAKIMAEVKGRPRLIRASLIRNGIVSESLPDAL